LDKAAVKDLFALEDALKTLLDIQRGLATLLEKKRLTLAAGDAGRANACCSTWAG